MLQTDIENFEVVDSLELDAASDTLSEAWLDDEPEEYEETVEEILPSWQYGIEGDPRLIHIGDNSGVLSIIAGIVIVMMLCYKRFRRLFATLREELFGMRKRANVFDEHTSSETSAMVLMALQCCICLGLLLYSWFVLCRSSRLAHILGTSFVVDPAFIDPSNVLISTSKLIGLSMAYYLMQYVAYWILGYTFCDDSGRRLYVQGFTSSQSVLGFTLLVPALVSIFYPGSAPEMVGIAVLLYVLARIVFIIKGFRIFYDKIGSLLYFILYLCTLEIIPLILVYKLALFLVESPMI